jgi:c(7)-type cytochrome triheme protein
LADDGIHDPDNPAIKVLQQPGDAMSSLPRDTVGNLVRWVKALDQGYIQPRANIESGTEIHTLDLDVVMKGTGDAPWVVFPHRPHTEWLDCTNCHNGLFATKAGATPVTMLAILSGEYCGRCHGAVSFPLTECARCHSMTVGSEIPAGAVSE